MPNLILPTQINPFRAKRFTICAKIGNDCYKLFQIVYPNRASAVYVNFPYLPNSKGIAAVAAMHGDGTTRHQLDLQQQGMLTSHLVKYSHHADGMAHFSQDRKVRTELRKQSTPLDRLNGHLFSASFGGIASFKKLQGDYRNLNSINNFGITLQFDQDPGWIKVMGFWYNSQSAARRFGGYAINGKVGPLIGDGVGSTSAFLAPWNRGSGGNSVLVLQARSLPDFRSTNGPGQIFVGGFDTEYRMNDLSQDTSVLVFNYPASDFDSLTEVMESIDYAPMAGPARGTLGK